MNQQKAFSLLAVMLLFWFCKVIAQQTEVPFDTGNKHLLIMHPSIQNLQTMQFLIDEEIFPLPADYRIIGIGYRHAAYNYELSEAFIEENNWHHMGMYWVEDSLSPLELFQNNSVSHHYRQLFEHSEGVIFFGGPDIPPLTYGQRTNLLTVVTDPHRHYFELSFLFHLLGGFQDVNFDAFLEEKPGYCILGICLGMQSMNVATGGSMIQDIPTQLYGFSTYEEILEAEQNIRHRVYRPYYPTEGNESRAYHQIRLREAGHMSVINKGLDLSPMVYSAHHQAVDHLGKGFHVTATSMDTRVVEAIEHRYYPNVIGVQFHPEARFLYERKEATDSSFMELYSTDKGTDFHLNFWKHMAGLLP